MNFISHSSYRTPITPVGPPPPCLRVPGPPPPIATGDLKPPPKPGPGPAPEGCRQARDGVGQLGGPARGNVASLQAQLDQLLTQAQALGVAIPGASASGDDVPVVADNVIVRGEPS